MDCLLAHSNSFSLIDLQYLYLPLTSKMKSTLKKTILFILVLLLIISALSLYNQSNFLKTFLAAKHIAQFIDLYILIPSCIFILAQSWSIYKFLNGNKFYRSTPYLFIPAISLYICLRFLIIGLFYLSHNLAEIDAMTFVDKFRLFFLV